MNWQFLFNISAIILFLGCALLAFLLIDKSEKINKSKRTIKELRSSFDELDEQAKLIVRTDLDLNKAQEELDKRLHGLDALHKISRKISTTLDEGEIFNRLQQTHLAELGFEKFIIITVDSDNKYQCRACVGYQTQSISPILTYWQNDPGFLTSLQKKQIISSLREERKTSFANLFKVESFIIAPLLAQKEILGFTFVGNQAETFAITEGDEELISILADQIGQSVKNARLFEQAYRSSQELEKKVQDRTHQLSSALEEVQKISKTKSEFISAVSHELRTPLTSIKGYASLLISGKLGDLPPAVKERLIKVNHHSDHLVKLINDLLDISRIESGKAEMKFVKQDINVLLENIEDLLTPQIKAKNIKFKRHLPSKIPTIFADPNHFERVFINLISNAIKFTPDQGSINVSVEFDNKEVKFCISDTGIGVPEEELEKLFDEFYRIDNEINQVTKGSGLGLSLVKKIIDAHHGKIWVTSELNKGTNFYFTIPQDHSKIP